MSVPDVHISEGAGPVQVCAILSVRAEGGVTCFPLPIILATLDHDSRGTDNFY